MKRRIAALYISINTVLAGCYQNHFYVQQQAIDRSYLASSHVGTPDPRQEHPPTGQQLSVNWEFPRSLFEQRLHLVLTVRFWDSTQVTLVRPISRRRGDEIFFFPNHPSELQKKILTYKVEAISEEGKVMGCWEHQFWTKLIDIGERESISSAQSSNISVSSQDMQASVTETP